MTLTFFKVSHVVANRLIDLSGLQQTSISYVVARCISAGHIVSRENLASRRFFAGDVPLIFPLPTPLELPLFTQIGFLVPPPAKVAFAALRAEYGLDDFSTLAWCIECFDIINEARVLDFVCSRDPRGQICFRAAWNLP